MILAGGIVLSGASAAFAVYVGTEAILGPPASSVSGLDCTNVAVVKLRINGQRWVRKFVKTESTDGLVRLKTALRVASVFSKSEKADLYQVVVLDQKGPDQRGGIRGRAIGAEVLFTPHPGDVTGMPAAFKARYIDGTANAAGLFGGEKIELPLDDVKAMIRGIDDQTDCTDPPLPEGEEAKASEHGKAKEKGHGKAAEKSGGHGEAAPSGHGEAAESGHGEAAPAEGEAAEHEAEGHDKKPHEPTFEDFAALSDDAGSHAAPEHVTAGHETVEPEAVEHKAAEQEPAGHGDAASDEAAVVHEDAIVPAQESHADTGHVEPVEIKAEGHATAHD